jgi:hypothetical protein
VQELLKSPAKEKSASEKPEVNITSSADLQLQEENSAEAPLSKILEEENE